MSDLRERLVQEHNVSLLKAWEALAGYKFWMFGYHAAHVVKARRLLGLKGNPFRDLVDLARGKIKRDTAREFFQAAGTEPKVMA